MFNHPLIHEEAKLKIQQREREAEACQWQKQLGFGERRSAPWTFVFSALVTIVMLLLLL
jgi:hypothetical protein